MKIRPVGAELFHAEGKTDRRTDMTPTVAFRNFANKTKKEHLYHTHTVRNYSSTSVNGYMNVTAGTQTRSNAGRI
jgi:hypothetical protein